MMLVRRELCGSGIAEFSLGKGAACGWFRGRLFNHRLEFKAHGRGDSNP
jgi:hypothetical protein